MDKKKIVIYGAGNTGRSAYFYLRNRYQCLYFVDSNMEHWGGKCEGLPIKSPEILTGLKDVGVVIASIFWEEILNGIKEIDGLKIWVYKPYSEMILPEKLKEGLNERTIHLGSFLSGQRKLECKELTFMPGGSQVLDYVFLKAVAETFKCKNYLEVGTYIGESINILTDCCEHLYSVTAAPGTSCSMASWCRQCNLPDYSEKLAYSDKISHFYTDSKLFDYSIIKEDIDLYFIDGDHSYEGVYADTKNIFNSKRENAIVVWHDFKISRGQYNTELILAVRDVLEKKFENVYVTDYNLCGIYLPESIQGCFMMNKLQYGKNEGLCTYDIVLDNCQVK